MIRAALKGPITVLVISSVFYCFDFSYAFNINQYLISSLEILQEPKDNKESTTIQDFGATGACFQLIGKDLLPKQRMVNYNCDYGNYTASDWK